MDSLTYLKIIFQPDSYPAYHFYYSLNKEQLAKYNIILNGSFNVDFGFYDSDQIDETMFEFINIQNNDEINLLFLSYDISKIHLIFLNMYIKKLIMMIKKLLNFLEIMRANMI